MLLIKKSYNFSDIIECMASSDNVVRLGLTPKFKDVNLLLEMLDYTPQTIDDTKFKPYISGEDPNVCVYNPPVDDFSVNKIQVILSFIVHVSSSLPITLPYVTKNFGKKLVF